MCCRLIYNLIGHPRPCWCVDLDSSQRQHIFLMTPLGNARRKIKFTSNDMENNGEDTGEKDDHTDVPHGAKCQHQSPHEHGWAPWWVEAKSGGKFNAVLKAICNTLKIVFLEIELKWFKFVFFVLMKHRKLIFFIKLKIIIGVSNVFEHACLCILFIVMGVFQHKIQKVIEKWPRESPS